MTHYVEWDFERKVATEYERRGWCNGCGECCTGELHYQYFPQPDSDIKSTREMYGGGPSVNGEGAWQEIREGDLRIFRQLTTYDPTGRLCPSLAGNVCTLHLTGKPMICQLWPVAPREIVPFTKCSFSFVKVDEWPIEDGE